MIDNPKRVFYILLTVTVIVFILGSLIWLAIIDYKDPNLRKLYYWGGIISGAFASLAFLAAMKTVRLQQEQNRLQKEISSKEQFENTFFNMQQLQQQIVASLRYKKSNGEIVEGRSLFRYLYDKKLYNNIRSEGLKKGYPDSGILHFDHYFRHLYRIMKFIDDPDHPDTIQRYKYAGMLRGTLSTYELLWLFYNCLYYPQFHVFKGLIEKYSMLKNIREDLLPRSRDLTEYLKLYPGLKYPTNEYEFRLTTQEFRPHLSKINISRNQYFITAFYNQKEISDTFITYIAWEDFQICREKEIDAGRDKNFKNSSFYKNWALKEIS